MRELFSQTHPFGKDDGQPLMLVAIRLFNFAPLSLAPDKLAPFRLAIESVKEAVCEKYNNFVDSDFSIDSPLIVKRKYYSGFQYTRNLKNNKVIVLHVMKGSEAENYLKEKDVILEVNDINFSSIKM